MRNPASILVLVSVLFAGSANAQPQVVIDPRFVETSGLFRNFSVSAGVNNLGVDYSGIGNVSQNTGIVCAETDVWDTALRYAGEFAGFRVAAAAGFCHGFGEVAEPIGGFDGKAQLDSLFTASLRAYLPQTIFAFTPYGTVGVAAGYFKVAAAPFEDFRGFRPGFFVGLGVESKPIKFKTDNARDITQPAVRVFVEYRYYEFSGDRLSGGLPFDLHMDTVTAGARLRY